MQRCKRKTPSAYLSQSRQRHCAGTFKFIGGFMALSNKDRSLISDIVFNQEFDFDAGDIQHQIMRDYGIQFAVSDIEDVIEVLYKDNCVEHDRCDKTADLFEVAA